LSVTNLRSFDLLSKMHYRTRATIFPWSYTFSFCQGVINLWYCSYPGNKIQGINVKLLCFMIMILYFTTWNHHYYPYCWWKTRNDLSRGWCKTVVTTLFYITNNSSFAPSPPYAAQHHTLGSCVLFIFPFWSIKNWIRNRFLS